MVRFDSFDANPTFKNTLAITEYLAEYAAEVARVTAVPSVQTWIQAALLEKDFVVMGEQYRVKSN